MVNSSTACVKHKSSLNNGKNTTTPNDRTVLWATAHRPPRPSSRWTKGLSCTNNQIGPLKWADQHALGPARQPIRTRTSVFSPSYQRMQFFPRPERNALAHNFRATALCRYRQRRQSHPYSRRRWMFFQIWPQPLHAFQTCLCHLEQARFV